MYPERDPEGVEIEQLQRLGRLDGQRVLEIGSGDGRLTWRYAATAALVAGVDPDPERLVAARAARPADLSTPLLLVEAQAETMPFPSNRFDRVVLAWSL
jgi:ubiquinone/menaquinone biosynthesis C-methylase UbiE